MTKAPKFFKNKPDTDYHYAELGLRNDTYSSIGVDISEGVLTVWNQGDNIDNVPISPKKLRKFARALLALADQVDPPAPVVHYFAVGGKTFYRVNDSSIELYSKWTTRWIPTTTGATTVEELNRHWYGHLTEITPDALPLAARQA